MIISIENNCSMRNESIKQTWYFHVREIQKMLICYSVLTQNSQFLCPSNIPGDSLRNQQICNVFWHSQHLGSLVFLFIWSLAYGIMSSLSGNFQASLDPTRAETWYHIMMSSINHISPEYNSPSYSTMHQL